MDLVHKNSIRALCVPVYCIKQYGDSLVREPVVANK